MAGTELTSLLALVPAFALLTMFHWSLHVGATRGATCAARPFCGTAFGAGRRESRSADGARVPPAACGAATALTEPIARLIAANDVMPPAQSHRAGAHERTVGCEPNDPPSRP